MTRLFTWTHTTMGLEDSGRYYNMRFRNLIPERETVGSSGLFTFFNGEIISIRVQICKNLQRLNCKHTETI